MGGTAGAAGARQPQHTTSARVLIIVHLVDPPVIPLHHGTFADGEAHPDSYAGEDHVGTFAEGEAHPDRYASGDHIGTFAEGEAHLDDQIGEGHVGSFAEGFGHAANR